MQLCSYSTASFTGSVVVMTVILPRGGGHHGTVMYHVIPECLEAPVRSLVESTERAEDTLCTMSWEPRRFFESTYSTESG